MSKQKYASYLLILTNVKLVYQISCIYSYYKLIKSDIIRLPKDSKNATESFDLNY